MRPHRTPPPALLPLPRPLLALALAVLGACVSPAPAPAPARAAHPPPRPAPPLSADPGSADVLAAEAAATERDGGGEPLPGGPRLTIATVAGEPIDVRALLARWLHHDSPDVHAYLSQLVAMRIAELEAARLGVVLDPGAVARRVAEVRGELERQVRSNAPGTTVERWLQVARGLDPERYFDVQRAETEKQMLAERVIRAWLLSQGWARVRVIVVEDEAALAEVRADLDRGEAFADVARARSLDETAENGGLIAALVKSELSPLSRLAFQTPVGEIGGPLEEEGRAFYLMEVESLHEPIEGSWAEVGERVEESLRERPLDETEYYQWEASLDRVYAPDLTPLFELAGEPKL